MPNMNAIIKKLTREEEQSYIDKYITDENYIHRGTSRAVYHGPEGQVVKIAIDDAGRIQNRNEIDFFEEYGDKGFFAEIFAYGEFIVVMEYVEIDNVGMFQEFWEHFDENYEDSELNYTWFEYNGFNINDPSEQERLEIERIDRLYADAYQIFDFMYEIGNMTADNDQIGFTGDGLKIYDYGFNVSYTTDSQVGRVSEMLQDGDSIQFRQALLTENDYIWKTLTPIEKLRMESR